MKLNFLLSLLILSCSASIAQNGDGASLSKQNDPKMEWWKAVQLGMFIHWGIYSVPAGKWGDKTTYGEWIMNSAKIPRAIFICSRNWLSQTKLGGLHDQEWPLGVQRF